jgi:ATP-dependent helicase HrpA
MVVDLGTHKVARYNHLGIQELRLENTAQANCLQRAGRSGRTKPGEYIRTNDTSFDELPRYPEAPLEREMLDKYILILLVNGIDIVKLQEEESSNGRRLFFHNFNKRLLDISYYRLIQIGAIDRTKNITPLGRDLLKLPLDVYHARMLREAIKRKCVEDILYVTAILEKK